MIAPPYRPWLVGALALFCAFPLAASEASHDAPVTIVAIPWGTARLNGGDAFVVPGTRLLEPGEYSLSVERQGYLTVERTIRVEDGTPQNHLIRLERR
jgi:hypothetical protein